jgi:hypothetical protein
MMQIALAGLGAALAGIVMDACFQAYLDPGLVVSLTTSLFLCQ